MLRSNQDKWMLDQFNLIFQIIVVFRFQEINVSNTIKDWKPKMKGVKMFRLKLLAIF